MAPGLVEAVADAAADGIALDQDDLVDFWSEAGNTFRYTGHREDALAAYEMAAQRCAGLPDEIRRVLILRRNVAIVLREAGRYRESHDLLAELAESDPDDHQVLHSMAAWFLETGRFDEAAHWVRRALAVPDLPRAATAALLTTLGDVQRRQGNHWGRGHVLPRPRG